MPTSSTKPKPCLIILDVGHGSAAVLHDEGGTVVFDAGTGAHVVRHLQTSSVNRLQTLLLSHADSDHIGGAITLLLDAEIKIEEVLVNSDASKPSAVFMQLCVALADANHRAGTRIDRRVVTSTRIERDGAQIEVLHPPDRWVLSRKLAKTDTGKTPTTNSLSAAIRVSRGQNSSVLLGGDIDFGCLDEWKVKGIQPSACVLVFPHHGGLPGTSDITEAGLFAFELVRTVRPAIVVFSNHRKQFGNPRAEVLTAILKANSAIRLACTQLPERFHPLVATSGSWSLHFAPDNAGIVEGSLCLQFEEGGIHCCFGEFPRA